MVDYLDRVPVTTAIAGLRKQIRDAAEAMRTIRTGKNRDDFLKTLSETANVTKTCEKSRIARNAMYEWRNEDPEFAAAWEEAVERGTDALEDEAVRRACEGTVRPVFHQGKECGGLREYSDLLMIFLLKARRPKKYREQQKQDDPNDPAPIAITGGLPT